MVRLRRIFINFKTVPKVINAIRGLMQPGGQVDEKERWCLRSPVCVSMCMRERKKGRERKTDIIWIPSINYALHYSHSSLLISFIFLLLISLGYQKVP